MKKPFHILLALPSLLIGILMVISCSEPSVDPIDLGTSNSLGDNDLTSSSSQENNSSSSSVQSNNGISSSSKETLPSVTIALPKSGYYSAADLPLSVKIPPETGNGIVRCETSGAAPNVNSLIKSDSTLIFSKKNAVLQCAYFKNGKIASKTIMRTYIIERLPDLPIVSIAVDPVKMFGSNPKGIYKNDYKPGAGCSGSFYSDEEIPMYIDFFEKGAEIKWSYPAGIKIHGGCSRKWSKKSVIVSFREEYGQKNLNYPLFPEHPKLTKFKHFMLRNNGNNYENDFIRDMLMSSLTEGLDIDYQKGRSVVVYYNGEYYGIHNLRERTNGDYFETNYGINEDYIDLVKVEKVDGKPEEVSKGSDADYQSIISWLNGVSLADSNNFKELEQRIDIDNFTNHFQSRIFYQDCDWPGKNMKRWRSSLTRSKWRWLLYDTDHGFGSWGTQVSGCGTMEYITSPTTTPTSPSNPNWPNPPHSTFLIRKLLENTSYRYAFINRFSLLLATYFTPTRINARIDTLMNRINSEIPYDKKRWTDRGFYRDLSTIISFGNSRQSDMQNNLTTFFKYGSPVDFTLSVTGGGKVFVHNLLLPSTSVKFKAYPNAPITIKAVGAGFKNWSNGVTAPEQTVTIKKDSIITANF